MRFGLFVGGSMLASLVASAATAQDGVVRTQGPDTVDEIVVVGQRAQQQRAIDIQRDATGIVSVAAADEIGQLPDRNVAEVVERLPGVGVQYDQGEGRYVSVRGIPSDLNNYTLNGFEIGNPDGNTRRLPLDIVSGQLLNRIEVSKVKTADQDGQGIGGTVNLVTQTAFDFRGDRFFQASVQAGYQELNEESPVRGDVSLGGRFGDFGVLVGVSYSDREYASYGLYPDDWAPFAGAARGALPINIKYTDYRLTRERIGAVTSLDWRPAGSTHLYLRGLYSRFTEDEYRQRYRLDFATTALRTAGAVRLNADGVTGTTTGATEIRQDLRLEYKEKSVLSVMAGGRTQFDAWTFDYGLSRSHNEVIEPNQLWQFRASPGVVDFDFSQRVFTAQPRTPITAAALGFRQYTEQNENGEEDIWSARLDARRDLDFGGDSYLTAGVKYRSTDKGFDANNAVWTRGANAATRFTLAQFDLAGPSVLVNPVDGRGYLISPTLNAATLVPWTAANQAGPYFLRDNASTLANATLADTDVGEDVLAGYLAANLDFGQWTLTPGLRVEQTRLDITGFRLENGTTVVPSSATRDYTDWLPTLIARYEPAENVVIRLGYGRTLGRANYLDLSPGGSLSYEDNGNGTFDGSLSSGNPQLEPYVSDGFDASAEWYFAPGGLLSLGGFAKIIDNPVYTRTIVQTNVDFGGRRYEILSFSQKQNGDSAEVYGLEAAWQQQFTFLPGAWSGFGINANVTVVESQLTVPGRGDVSGFPEQSELLYGVQLFYQDGPVEASLAYHNTGHSLIALGGAALTDQYNDDLRRLDAKATVAINENVSIFGEAQNLTDEPTRQYQGDRSDWETQNERYGRVFNAGLTLKW